MHNFKNKTFFENNFACAKGPSCLSDVRVPRYGQATLYQCKCMGYFTVYRFTVKKHLLSRSCMINVSFISMQINILDQLHSKV